MTSPLVALITGANSGIGFACAEALALKGYKVYACYRNPGRAGKLRELSRRLPVMPLRMNVDQTASVEKAVGAVRKREGKIDVLLNNAGYVMAGFWEDLSEEDVLRQFETNVFGLLRVTRAVLPLMRERGRGRIFNIGSVAGFTAIPGLGAYSATKFAVTCLTETLRVEAAPFGVEVSEISLGEIQTSIVQNVRLGEKVGSPDSAYRVFTENFRQFQEKRFHRAAPVEKVTEVVLKALAQGSLKRRYLVKPEDHILYWLRRFLPDVFWEWGLERMFPWSRFPKG